MKSRCADHGENWRQDCESCAMAQRTNWHSLRPPVTLQGGYIERLESRLGDLREQHASERRNYERRCAELQSQLADAERERESFRDNNNQLCDAIDRLESQLAAAEKERDSLKSDRDKFLASDDCYYWTPEAQKERDRLREAIEGDNLTAKRVYKLLEQRDELAAALDEARAESERISKIVTDNAIQYAKELADAFSERDRLRAENEKLVKALDEALTLADTPERNQGDEWYQKREQIGKVQEMYNRKALADAGRGREG